MKEVFTHVTEAEHVTAVFCDRNDGVSVFPFNSCNVSSYVGDETICVEQNRAGLRERLQVEALLFAKQVHGVDVFCLDHPLQQDTEIGGYDAFITDQKDVGLVIQQADCQGVLLYDPQKKVIGAVHSGWRGSVQNIIGNCVHQMISRYGCDPEDIVAAVSPSLGPCCAEFIHYKTELPPAFHSFMVKENYFDFWKISVHQLTECGISRENIGVASTCTLCDTNYFSYRRAVKESGGKCGRQCSVIALR